MLFILLNVWKIVYLHILWCLIHPWTRNSDQRQTPAEAHKTTNYELWLQDISLIAVQIHDCLIAVRLYCSYGY